MTATSLTRWYRPTPDRLIVGLLAVEAILLLSNAIGCFHKGWAVLTAIAIVGVTLLAMVFWLGLALLFRVAFQYGLRSLFLLVVAVAIPCSWLATEMQQVNKQREAVKAIGKVGGMALYDYNYDHSGHVIFNTTSSGPLWLRNLLGDDLFADVVSVDFIHYGRLPPTDADLERLKPLVRLEELWFRGARISDAGLVHLKGLQHLRRLALNGTEITDAGLEHLKGLSHLRRLWLRGTKVTDEGIKRLQRELPDCEISH